MLKLVVLLGFVAFASASPLHPFVVNGTDANIEDHPYMVSIRVFGSHNCGGSILNNSWILCAAHCSGDSIQFGTHSLGSDPSTVVGIRRWIRHENYSAFTLQNDVAVIELEKPLNFSKTVQPTKLPQKFYEAPGDWKTPVILTGFGLNATSGSIQNRLQKVTIYTVSNTECKKRHSNTVYDSMLCAGVATGGKGQCSGDSGGPLILEDGTQVGLVSWSMKPCTIAPYPGVYTKVSHFIDWIRNKTMNA